MEEEWGRGNVVDVVFYDGGCFKGCLGGGRDVSRGTGFVLGREVSSGW